MRIATTLQPRGPAAAIVLTEEQRQELAGDRKAVPVRVTVNGKDIALRLARMGGENLIGFSKAARAEAGVETGDDVEVEIVVDDAPREIEVPDDLAAALDAQPGVRAVFDALAPSKRKELARSVADAKKPQTREKRIAAALASLSRG